MEKIVSNKTHLNRITLNLELLLHKSKLDYKLRKQIIHNMEEVL
jgi:hypothetical protein